MRLYTFETTGTVRIGAEGSGGLIDLNAAHAARLGQKSAVLAESMIDLVRGGKGALRQARQALAFARRAGAKRAAKWTYDLADVTLLAPIPRPGKILCSGLNYKSHLDEEPGAALLKDPRFFSKLPSCVIGPGAPIRHPGARFLVDYEVELAVVFGQSCHRVAQGDAMTHVFGYTILHDVSARWIQFKDANETMGKNFDTFAPMGPCLVTADEIPDPAALRLQLALNGRIMQDERNTDWCFALPRMIEWLSMAMTLEPGDVMSTGTPAGVGCFREPAVYLKPGDVCELTIEGIGTLVNSVKADPYTFLTRPRR
jgi:2-keto-4-pentenoate hydratase/2-oxohepta-3-ene-1,7-dioic acid hydratase in catechol pathway